MSGFTDVVGEAALSASLATRTDVVSVTQLGGFKEFGSSSYHSGYEKATAPTASLQAAPRDRQVFRIVFDS